MINTWAKFDRQNNKETVWLSYQYLAYSISFIKHCKHWSWRHV